TAVSASGCQAPLISSDGPRSNSPSRMSLAPYTFRCTTAVELIASRHDRVIRSLRASPRSFSRSRSPRIRKMNPGETPLVAAPFPERDVGHQVDHLPGTVVVDLDAVDGLLLVEQVLPLQNVRRDANCRREQQQVAPEQPRAEQAQQKAGDGCCRLGHGLFP